MSTPHCAVIVPTYNRADWLGGCIESITNSGLSADIIVVDDGSVDDTALVANRHRVTYIQQPHSCSSAARNQGLRASQAPFIAFLDDDDRFLPGHHARMVEFLQAHAEVAMVFSDFMLDGVRAIKDGRRYAGLYQLPCQMLAPDFRLLDSQRLLWSLLPGECFIIPSTTVIRRSVLDEVGFWDETMTPIEDLELWIRLLCRFKVAYYDAAASVYTSHDHNMSKNYWLCFRQYDVLLEKISSGRPPLPDPLRRTASLRWARAAFHLGEHALTRVRLAQHTRQWGWEATAALYWLASWSSPRLVERVRRLTRRAHPER